MSKMSTLFAGAMMSLVPVFGLVIAGSSVLATSSKVNAAALGGTDLVSYFAAGKQPVAGKAQFAVTHDGKIYHFASQANADAFKKTPLAFLPQYAGKCAWAAAQGYIAPGDPKYASVVGGKLYFNYNASVKADWSKDIPGFIIKADKNWPGIADKAK